MSERGITVEDKKAINKTINDIEYTIVLDRDQLPSDILKQDSEGRNDLRENIDLLYKEYEKMRLSEPAVTDPEDIYPRSYQWRMGDRYDMGKVAALEEALKKWVSIEETEAYKAYIETVSQKESASFKWD